MAAGVYSYGVAAVAYLLLSLLLVTGWRGRTNGGLRLIAACAVTAVWAALMALLELRDEVPLYAAALLLFALRAAEGLPLAELDHALGIVERREGMKVLLYP